MGFAINCVQNMKHRSETSTLLESWSYTKCPAVLGCCCITSAVNGDRMQSRGVQHHILQCPADSRPCATTSDHATCGGENQVTQQELNWNCICF